MIYNTYVLPNYGMGSQFVVVEAVTKGEEREREVLKEWKRKEERKQGKFCSNGLEQQEEMH